MESVSVSDNDGVSDNNDTLGLNNGNDVLLVEYFGGDLANVDAKQRIAAKMVNEYIFFWLCFSIIYSWL